jgi:citrate lyase subunit beta / citryl-CoA lyase
VDLLRSLLFVPAIQPTMLARAAERGADAIVIDLEDSVPPNDKERARAAAAEAVPGLARDGLPVWVRVNPSQRLLTKPDLRAVVSPALTGVLLPKAMSRNHIHYVEALLRDAEALNGVEPGATKLIAMIEGAAALLACQEIATASPRLVALAFGGEDYCLDLGVERTRGGHELQYPRSHIAVCARAAGVLAIDTIYDDFRDEAGLRADTEAARSVGFHGKLVIHPNQIGTVNGIFRPTPEAVEYARRIVEAHEAAIEAGDGAIHIEGRMIDRPVADRARRVIELATAIEAREGQSSI